MNFLICSKHNFTVVVQPWENWSKIIWTRKCSKCMMGQ
jgi:hypothetical protein